MPDIKQVWGNVLGEIELTVSKANFGTWFKNTQAVKQENGIMYVGVPNTFVKDWIVQKYHKLILKCIRELIPDTRALEYLIIKNHEADKLIPKENEVKSPFTPEQLNINELYINKEDNLNPRYIFDSFVVGPFNELAHASTQAVVKKIGLVYNPLFIYGGTGLGKTHLIQAVGNYVKTHQPQKKVFYVTSEQFVVDYVNSVQNNKGNVFKEKYRKYDILIMDDIQFLSNKDRTQEELFHLFNHFYENNKQIIFSSDKAPKNITHLEDRLRSRFEGGMIVDVIKPDYESRLAILKTKLKNSPFYPHPEIIEFLASNIQDNIRELEGATNIIICQSQLKNRNLNLAEVKTLIKTSIRPKKSLSIEDVTVVVSNFYNINEKTLCEKTRKKEVVRPRQILMYILREDFNTSYPYIGQKLGGRDHTTVIHAYDKIKQDLKENAMLAQEIEQIRGLLYN